jgi:hypothetical protein
LSLSVPAVFCVVIVFFSRHRLLSAGHIQILMQVPNDLGVTSVAGFRWIL